MAFKCQIYFDLRHLVQVTNHIISNRCSLRLFPVEFRFLFAEFGEGKNAAFRRRVKTKNQSPTRNEYLGSLLPLFSIFCKFQSTAMDPNLQSRSPEASSPPPSQDPPAAEVPPHHSPPPQSPSPKQSPSSAAMRPGDGVSRGGDAIQSVCSSAALDDFLANGTDLKVSNSALHMQTDLEISTG